MGSIHYLDKNIRYLYASEGENIISSQSFRDYLSRVGVVPDTILQSTFDGEVSSKFVIDIIVGSFAHYYDMGAPRFSQILLSYMRNTDFCHLSDSIKTTINSCESDLWSSNIVNLETFNLESYVIKSHLIGCFLFKLRQHTDAALREEIASMVQYLYLFSCVFKSFEHCNMDDLIFNINALDLREKQILEVLLKSNIKAADTATEFKNNIDVLNYRMSLRKNIPLVLNLIEQDIEMIYAEYCEKPFKDIDLTFKNYDEFCSIFDQTQAA